jgi:hypothetical protein
MSGAATGTHHQWFPARNTSLPQPASAVNGGRSPLGQLHPPAFPL